MSGVTKSRRGQRRFAVALGKLARVEFSHPGPNGQFYDLEVTNVSSSGVSFCLEENHELASLEEGTSLSGVVIRIGDCMIRGEMVVMHLTDDTGSRRICGALFYPATDTDLVQLRGLIAGMEIADAD